MPQFSSRSPIGPSVDIAYETSGDGPPIVLIHGFASHREANWRTPSWYRTLAEAGRRIIAFDCRGHGESGKLHDPADYDEGLMAGDALRLMDHLGIVRADVVGYSMGGFLTLRLLADAPSRVARAVIAGVGQNYIEPLTVDAERVAAALLAPDPESVADPVALGYRTFAARLGGDLRALAACMRRPRTALTAADFRALAVPALVICGEKDSVSGPPEPLARLLPRGEARTVPGRDHMSAVGDKITKAEVLAFFERHAALAPAA